jgi:N-acetylmuramoyl-L-alanine amidase
LKGRLALLVAGALALAVVLRARAPAVVSLRAKRARIHAVSIPRDVRPAPPLRERWLGLDAGHGAPNNRGNTSWNGEREDDATLRLVEELAPRVEARGVRVRLLRAPGQVVPYWERVARAQGLDAVVSVHTDIREGGSTSPASRIDVTSPGFAVLVSDEGDADTVTPRLSLATELERSLRARGFVAYDGRGYAGSYERVGVGAWVDRHPTPQRVYLLYAVEAPTVLLEAFHALDPREDALFREPATLDALASAVVDAVSRAELH